MPSGILYISVEAVSGDALWEGENNLTLAIEPEADGAPCGVYARGRVSVYSVAHTEPLTRAAVRADMDIGYKLLDGGTLLRARQWATNRAGLASAVEVCARDRTRHRTRERARVLSSP